MIAMVTLAEERLQRSAASGIRGCAAARTRVAAAAEVAPILRGVCALAMQTGRGACKRLVCEFRTSEAILDYVNGAELDALRARRRHHARPHHPHQELAADRAGAGRGPARRLQARGARGGRRRSSPTTTPISPATTPASAAAARCSIPLPRVILVPGLGLFGLGRSRPDARIAADIAECAVDVMTDAEAIGEFRSDQRGRPVRHANTGRWSRPSWRAAASRRWPVRSSSSPAAAGRSARPRRERSRRPAPRWRCSTSTRRRPRQGAQAIGGTALAIGCDVTDAASRARRLRPGRRDLRRRRHRGVERRRGLAGPHRRGRRSRAAPELRAEFLCPPERGPERRCAIMLAQGTGGCLLFNVSKQAVNPGPNFGPYGLPKAATLFLVRQYALDYGADGIRANAVNADRIRSRPVDRRSDRGASQGARGEREGLHERQPARPRGDRRGRGAGLPAPGAGAEDHRRRDHRRRRQHRRGVALDVIPVLVTGIHRAAGAGVRGLLDTGDKPRYDRA